MFCINIPNDRSTRSLQRIIMLEELKYLYLGIVFAGVLIVMTIYSCSHLYVYLYLLLPIAIISFAIGYYVYDRFSNDYDEQDEDSTVLPWRNLIGSPEDKNDLPPPYESVVRSDIPTISATLPPSYEQVLNQYNGISALLVEQNWNNSSNNSNNSTDVCEHSALECTAIDIYI